MLDIIEKIPIDLIDDPSAPMRSQMDDEKLDELARSIRTHGLIQPITLRKVGERYEVIAGHRRYKACKRAEQPTIVAIVRELTDEKADGMRMHENLYREDINPVDEARYIKIMIEKHKTEPAELAKITGKSEAYLQARYDLLNYPDYILDAVEKEQISLAAAVWLNRITNDAVRREYTRFGIQGGITAKRANAWFLSWQAGALPRDASTYVFPIATEIGEARALRAECTICRNDDNIENMSLQYAHRECVEAVKEVQARSGK